MIPLSRLWRKEDADECRLQSSEAINRDTCTKIASGITFRQHYHITLNTIKKICSFTDICQRADAQVTVYDDSQCPVAGDSIMGLFSINLLHPINMMVEGNKAAIKRFIAEIQQTGIDVERLKKNDDKQK